MMDFASLSLIFTIPVFIAAAVVVWIAGVKITGDIDIVSDEAGLGCLARFSGPAARASDLERLK
jgi:nitrous oxidase accessory protein NosD